MPYTYILYSQTLDRYYIGSTRDTTKERLSKHNHKHKGFTSVVDDWKILYQEFYEEYSDALVREREIKQWKSRKMIETLIVKAPVF
jgi:putative endonuclease